MTWFTVLTGCPEINGEQVRGNPLEWILETIDRSLRLFRTSGLRVHIVSYGRSRPEIEALVRKHAAFE
jgi:hypothetical protein